MNSVHFRTTLLVHMVVGFLLLFSPIFLFAQEDDEECEKANKKAKKYYDNALRVNLRGQEAYLNLKKAIEIDPSYAAAHSALAYINIKKADRALINGKISDLKQGELLAQKYWKLAIEACASYRNWEAWFLLGEFYYSRKQYADAKAYLATYVENTNPVANKDFETASQYHKEVSAAMQHEIDSKRIRDSLINHPVPYNPTKVKGSSTPRDEYLPVLSPDNRYLFFTRKEMVANRFGSEEPQERFNRSKNNYDKSFTKGIPMPFPFNQGRFQGAATISVDNKLIVMTVLVPEQYRHGPEYMGNLYYSQFDGSDWSELKSVGDSVNAKTWEGQPSISADNQTIYFSSSREPDGIHNYGGMDLYKTVMRPNGKWSRPINLGPQINTPGNEKTPFMHSDSYTLYFASDYHPGIGKFDIFRTQMDKHGDFQTPKNIGYPINSKNDEHGFVVSTDGRYGYFSSNLDGNSLDIYSFEIPEQSRPEEVVFVRGQIISGSDAAKDLEITLQNTETKKQVNAVVDEETGEYVGVIAVKKGQDAIMTAKKEGYAFSSQYISSTENVVGKPIETKMEVKKIEVGETYKINNITFATNSYALNNKVKVILDGFVDFLKTNPSVKVVIQGHTDNEGDAKKNQILSENRAQSVSNYLVSQGIEASRLSHVGFGQSQPIADNSTAEGRRSNRRTEFLIVSK